MERDDTERSSRRTAASSVLLPLTVAFAYLDALAKTWLALGEKLSTNLRFRQDKNKPSNRPLCPNTSSSPDLEQTDPTRTEVGAADHALSLKHDRAAATTTALPSRSDDRELSPRRREQQQQQQQRRCWRDSDGHRDRERRGGSRRLEFSLAQFLAAHVRRRPSRSEADDVPRTTEPLSFPATASPSPELPPPGPGSDSSHAPSRTSGRLAEPVSNDEDSRSPTSHNWSLRPPHGVCRMSPATSGLLISKRHRSTDKTLVLDLDETLIHARRELGPGDRFDFLVTIPERTEPRAKQKSVLALCAGRESTADIPFEGGVHVRSSSSVGVAAYVDRRRSGAWIGGATNGKERLTASRHSWSSGFRSSVGRMDANSTSNSNSGVVDHFRQRRIYVRKRPHLREFLEVVSGQFEVVLFTAARAEFAEAVVKEIDPRRELVDHVLSRESCTHLKMNNVAAGGGNGRTTVVKDLTVIGRPLSKVIMVENSPEAIRYHLENGLQIPSFYGKSDDTELLSTLDVLLLLAEEADVRNGIIRHYVQTQARKEGHHLSPDALPGTALLH